MNAHAIAYAIVSRLLGLVAPIWLRHRISKGKEWEQRVHERYGRSNISRPAGKLVWFHGASLGETKLLLPVIQGMRERHNDLNVLVTSGTLSSATHLNLGETTPRDIHDDEVNPNKATHQFLPLDAPAFVSRFLDHWQPDLAVWAESEIWPNLVNQTSKKGIPMALINARMNKSSIQNWKKSGSFGRRLFERFDLIRAADSATAQGLGDILGRNLSVYGNLKTESRKPEFSRTEFAVLKEKLINRNIWTAASTHKSEIEIFAKAARSTENALMIWVPRHPETATDILPSLKSLRVAQRSKDEIPDEDTDVYLFDTFGEMGLALALSRICVMGGSFSPELTGHNPLEPVRLGNATVTGPYYASFKDIYEPFVLAEAIKTLQPDDDLGQQVNRLFKNSQALDKMIDRAYTIDRKGTGLMSDTINALESLIFEKPTP